MKYLIKTFIGTAIIVIAIITLVIVVIVDHVGINAVLTWLSRVGAEIITAIATIVIALFALIATIWQGVYNHEHNKLSVRPLINFTSRIGVDSNEKNKGKVKNKNIKRLGIFEVFIVNRGVGPAIIKNFILKFNGVIKSDNNGRKYHIFFDELLKDFNIIKVSHCASGNALKAGEEFAIIAFNFDIDNYDIDFINKIEILIEYQSIYKDKVIPKKYKNAQKLDYKDF